MSVSTAAMTGDTFAAALLPLQRVVVFPGTVTPITVTRAQHLMLLDTSARAGSPLVVALQHADGDIADVGCLVRAHRMVRLHDGSQRLALAAECRVRRAVAGAPHFVRDDIPAGADHDAALTMLLTAIHTRLARVGAVLPDAIASAVGLEETAYAAAALLLRHDPVMQQQLLESANFDTLTHALVATLAGR